LETAGIWQHLGIAVASFDSPAEASAATDADPLIQANQRISFEIHPMPLGAVRS
jgi:hypothetical protein